mmetsp:Transcript_14732/g.35957  ORF Transcript_14732/g.35957 Transcript_14732/m.35957 type:complete len:231 (-) Transcript_14732:450-1142(-)
MFGKRSTAAIAAASVTAGALVGYLTAKFAPDLSQLLSELKHSTDGKWQKRALEPAPPSKYDKWVEVYDEPRHFVEMDNMYCRIIRFRFPPGDKTEYHRHRVDSFFVFFNSTRVRNELQGAPLEEFGIKEGTASGACYCTKPIIHRISNIGPRWMHGLDVEIKSFDSNEYKTLPLPETKNIKLLFDSKTNGGKHIRVYSIVIKLGQTAKLSLAFPKLFMCYKGLNLSYSLQ